MKQKDIALIIIVSGISGIISFVASNAMFGAAKHNTQVEVVQAITSEFNKPDSKYFNKDSINPTKLISIGDNTNPIPFVPGQTDAVSQ